MNNETSQFYPFYDPYRGGDTLGYPAKISISLGCGAFYLLLQYYALPDKMVFFRQYCWILGVIIMTAIMTVYIATDVFRRSLVTMNEFEGDDHISREIISTWLGNKRFLIAGVGFATINTSVAHLLGVPVELHATPLALAMVYVGFFMAGFTSGIGMVAIFTVILLYLKFTPNLQHSLDPENPDGFGGIKKLGDSLWYFAMLVAAVGVLVSIYLLGVQWAYVSKGYVRAILIFWVALPYIVAISVVLIPGLAVRRQISYYKSYTANQLRQEKARLYSSFKQFEEKEDDEIIAEKKELNERLNRIQTQMEKLREMRTSHIDGKDKS